MQRIDSGEGLPKYRQYKLMLKNVDTGTDGRTGLNANFPYHRYKKRLRNNAPPPPPLCTLSYNPSHQEEIDILKEKWRTSQ